MTGNDIGDFFNALLFGFLAVVLMVGGCVLTLVMMVLITCGVVHTFGWLFLGIVLAVVGYAMLRIGSGE